MNALLVCFSEKVVEYKVIDHSQKQVAQLTMNSSDLNLENLGAYSPREVTTQHSAFMHLVEEWQQYKKYFCSLF
jgi:hypothetical protein